jgi:lipopolysaccharide/colanic/teichoic acid biosynthesis glycosyltransferase
MAAAFVTKSRRSVAPPGYFLATDDDTTRVGTPKLPSFSEMRQTLLGNRMNKEIGPLAKLVDPLSPAVTRQRRERAYTLHPWWKRMLDLASCAAGFPLLVLTTIAMAAIVQINSPGPVFFRQERVGYLGRRFWLYKFRTMHVGAAISTHEKYTAQLLISNRPMQKLDAVCDQRMIPCGRWLRASGLDELPQLINVFRGEMSLVGPRPCLPYEFEHYTVWHRQRLACAPGITGLWQVSGKNRLSFAEMVELDIAYAKKRSIGLDFWIVIRTLPTLCDQIAATRAARR